VASVFVHRLDVEDTGTITKALSRLQPDAKLCVTTAKANVSSVRAMLEALFPAKEVVAHSPKQAEVEPLVQAKPGEFLEFESGRPVVRGALWRFKQAWQLVSRIAELRGDVLDSKADEEQKNEYDALRVLFAQIPAALQNPQLATLPPVGADMTLLEWFAETFKLDDTGFVNQQLPVVIAISDKTAQEVAEMNDDATEQLVGLGAEKHVFVQAVEPSEALRERPGRWALMSTVSSPVLKLAVGMPVLLLHTLQAETMEQGMVGRVLAFENGCKPIVSFYGPERMVLALEPVVFKPTLGLSLASPVWARVAQFPLAPAFFLHESLVRAVPLRSPGCKWV
jgi:hypothetical protein